MSKSVIITGASSSTGYETSLTFARASYNAIITYLASTKEVIDLNVQLTK